MRNEPMSQIIETLVVLGIAAAAIGLVILLLIRTRE